MKPRLIILSDLWGKGKSHWIEGYVKLLVDKFDIHYYDCCDLGEVDSVNCDEKNLHNQFVNGGIERAVDALLIKEKKAVTVLAFSIGGTIAWKAALKGLNIETLVAISSTRLRYEAQVPNCKLKLYFGEEDNYKPDGNWFKNCQILPEINKNKGHLMYLEKDFIHLVCNAILNSYS